MKIPYIVALFLFSLSLSAQIIPHKHLEKDKCGFDLEKSKLMHEKLGDKWGYGFDSLQVDLNYWNSFNQVSTTIIGESTLGREIYELIITEDIVTKNTKPRIYIHARTHPNEVQSFWVTDEIINLLLGDTPFGTFMRQQCIFHIVPMFNPDGVELEKPRENANDIDIESNWGNQNPEQEVVVLRSRFEQLMEEDNQIIIALNMHSAYDCTRYFVYHHENGTSAEFAELEIDFIESIRQYFMSGIKPYNYFVSWTSGTPNYYPESWWWFNYEESVMALTYEDMNCEAAGDFDKTAFAIVRGIADYLDLGYVNIPENYTDTDDIAVYPNPFSDKLKISFNSNVQHQIIIVDQLGRIVYEKFSKNLFNKELDLGFLNEGVYKLILIDNEEVISKTIMKY